MSRSSAPRRSGLALVMALLALAGAGPASPPVAVAAIPTSFPNLSQGDRGTNVATVQQLIRHHQSPRAGSTGARTVVVGAVNPAVAPIDGVFGTSTTAAVRAFQGSRALLATGVVDAVTWQHLVVQLSSGATGDAVVALQRLLVEKRGAAVPPDGIFGAATRAAVAAFQGHMGLAATGSADAATWRALVAHFELPRFSASALCDYSVGNGPANWGTAGTIAVVEAAGAAMVGAGFGRVAVGDVSFEHGGDIPGHETHERGLDADLRLMRHANDQCTARSNWRLTSYDRAATRALVKAIRAAAPGHVKLVYFNDPVLVGEGLTTSFAGHDDHLHVRLCEVSYPLPAYRC
ncbi:MAG TPA: penicillin-insensitive murein endopeptidase [Candidatus Limnocylindrales bacterium]|nr:penicillin-insensitive murein endopeptidase [Candidatus Limnocylindrales bacterium]